MNEPAARLEEQIISLFFTLETEVYQGGINYFPLSRPLCFVVHLC